MNTSGSATKRCLHQKISWIQPLGVGARQGWPSACLLKGLLQLVAYSVTKNVISGILCHQNKAGLVQTDLSLTLACQ